MIPSVDEFLSQCFKQYSFRGILEALEILCFTGARLIQSAESVPAECLKGEAQILQALSQGMESWELVCDS